MRISEIITEPSKIYTDSTFKLKIKLVGQYVYKQNIETEQNINIVSENNEKIITEWGI